MKTLVIHPDDRTTDFLKHIYEGKGYDVITERSDRQIPMSKIIEEVRNHDRILMLGHGCSFGLLGFCDTFMNKEFIEVLRTKECVCIWCNANNYVEREGIKGFYTGMFISEVGEARAYGITIDQEKVTYSNELFGELMGTMVESPNVLNEIKTSYIGECPVIKFNNERLYYKNDNIKVKKQYDKQFLIF